MDAELYRIGLTKVLFKAGVLGTLEEHRDAAISGYLVALQSQIRCYLMKKNIQKMIEAKKAISTAQKNCRAYNVLKNWNWWKLMTFVKPLLQNAKKEV
jgi:myosin heavy subunit